MSQPQKQKSPRGKRGTYSRVISKTTSESLRLVEPERPVNNENPQTPANLSLPPPQYPSSSFQVTNVVHSRGDGCVDSPEDESRSDDISRVTDLETPSCSEETYSKDVDEEVTGAISAPFSENIQPLVPSEDYMTIKDIQVLPSNTISMQPFTLPCVSVTMSPIQMGPVPFPLLLSPFEQVEPKITYAENVFIAKCHRRIGRFEVVRVESIGPFRRGRWKCHDYVDDSEYAPKTDWVYYKDHYIKKSELKEIRRKEEKENISKVNVCTATLVQQPHGALYSQVCQFKAYSGNIHDTCNTVQSNLQQISSFAVNQSPALQAQIAGNVYLPNLPVQQCNVIDQNLSFTTQNQATFQQHEISSNMQGMVCHSQIGSNFPNQNLILVQNQSVSNPLINQNLVQSPTTVNQYVQVMAGQNQIASDLQRQNLISAQNQMPQFSRPIEGQVLTSLPLYTQPSADQSSIVQNQTQNYQPLNYQVQYKPATDLQSFPAIQEQKFANQIPTTNIQQTQQFLPQQSTMTSVQNPVLEAQQNFFLNQQTGFATVNPQSSANILAQNQTYQRSGSMESYATGIQGHVAYVCQQDFTSPQSTLSADQILNPMVMQGRAFNNREVNLQGQNVQSSVLATQRSVPNFGAYLSTPNYGTGSTINNNETVAVSGLNYMLNQSQGANIQQSYFSTPQPLSNIQSAQVNTAIPQMSQWPFDSATAQVPSSVSRESVAYGRTGFQNYAQISGTNPLATQIISLSTQNDQLTFSPRQSDISTGSLPSQQSGYPTWKSADMPLKAISMPYFPECNPILSNLIQGSIAHTPPQTPTNIPIQAMSTATFLTPQIQGSVLQTPPHTPVTVWQQPIMQHTIAPFEQGGTTDARQPQSRTTPVPHFSSTPCISGQVCVHRPSSLYQHGSYASVMDESQHQRSTLSHSLPSTPTYTLIHRRSTEDTRLMRDSDVSDLSEGEVNEIITEVADYVDSERMRRIGGSGNQPEGSLLTPVDNEESGEEFIIVVKRNRHKASPHVTTADNTVQTISQVIENVSADSVTQEDIPKINVRDVIHGNDIRTSEVLTDENVIRTESPTSFHETFHEFEEVVVIDSIIDSFIQNNSIIVDPTSKIIDDSKLEDSEEETVIGTVKFCLKSIFQKAMENVEKNIKKKTQDFNVEDSDVTEQTTDSLPEPTVHTLFDSETGRTLTLGDKGTEPYIPPFSNLNTRASVSDHTSTKSDYIKSMTITSKSFEKPEDSETSQFLHYEESSQPTETWSIRASGGDQKACVSFLESPSSGGSLSVQMSEDAQQMKLDTCGSAASLGQTEYTESSEVSCNVSSDSTILTPRSETSDDTIMSAPCPSSVSENLEHDSTEITESEGTSGEPEERYGRDFESYPYQPGHSKIGDAVISTVVVPTSVVSTRDSVTDSATQSETRLSELRDEYSTNTPKSEDTSPRTEENSGKVTPTPSAATLVSSDGRGPATVKPPSSIAYVSSDAHGLATTPPSPATSASSDVHERATRAASHSIPDPQRVIKSSVEEIERVTSCASSVIDNKIEEAMDLVKTHLMHTMRAEVESLKARIAELMERIQQLELENDFLKANASPEVLNALNSGAALVHTPTVQYDESDTERIESDTN